MAAARVDVEVAATRQQLHQICDVEVSGGRKILDAGEATGGALVGEERSARWGQRVRAAQQRRRSGLASHGGKWDIRIVAEVVNGSMSRPTVRDKMLGYGELLGRR